MQVYAPSPVRRGRHHASRGFRPVQIERSGFRRTHGYAPGPADFGGDCGWISKCARLKGLLYLSELSELTVFQNRLSAFVYSFKKCPLTERVSTPTFRLPF